MAQASKKGSRYRVTDSCKGSLGRADLDRLSVDELLSAVERREGGLGIAVDFDQLRLLLTSKNKKTPNNG